MGKTLVLAEKPSVGRELARVLGCKQKGNGFLAGNQYIVTWALGHLVTLADPECYGKQYKTWSLDTLPMLPDKMELEVIPQTAHQYSIVKKLLHSKEVSELIIATDAGREGELVARWILEKAGFHKPIRRLWISSQTDKAIREGFRHLRPGKDYENLYHSAQARAEADWLVGLNVTRAMTCKFNAQLSAGRVQTPTLALLVAREEEIKRFVPKDFYTLRADLGNLSALWTGKNGSSIFDRDRAESLAAQVKGKPFRLVSLRTAEKRTPPPLLYDLTELQRDANKRFGYSPKQTLNIMQKLYEQHKVLTYPRTDSRYLTGDIVPTLAERIRACSAGESAEAASTVLKHGWKITSSCINNAKVSDHHAIIPTEEKIRFSVLTSEEKNIYQLVVNRFLACFYPPFIAKHIKAEFEAEGQRFLASGQEIVQKGWRQIELPPDDETEEETQNLSGLKQGTEYLCRGVQIKQSKTSPPPRYTEATLLSAMENPGRFVQDKAMREYLGGGLGTPATRADIIDKLYSAFYVEKHGNSMVPTSRGRQIIQLVPPELKEPVLTAKWEQRLTAISLGKESKEKFVREIRSYAAGLVKEVVASTAQYTHDNITGNICPECGKFLLKVNGKHGKMLICQDRECGYRRNVSIKTNVRCPNCHKKMDLYGEGDKKTYICPCGYREKLDAFKKRMNGNQKGASKQDVRSYLKKQAQQDDVNDIFAAALEKALEKKKKS